MPGSIKFLFYPLDRHSHASLLVELGFSPLEIAERLGHEKIIYCEEKELLAMMEILRQYSEFIEYVVAEGAKDLLERYSYKEDSVERIWQERVDFRLEWPEEVRAEII